MINKKMKNKNSGRRTDQSDNSLSSRNNPRANLYKTPALGLSLRHRCNLRYNQSTTLTPSGATVSAYVFRLNGMFDPDFTGTGHQPMGFDQLSLLYNHFTVESARVKIEWGNDSTFDGGLLGWQITDTSAVTTPLSRRLECAWTKYNLINDQCFPLVQKTSVDIGQFLGRNVRDYEDATLSGTPSADPTEQVFLIVWAQLLNSGAAALNIDINVTIDYFAAFTEPKDLTQS